MVLVVIAHVLGYPIDWPVIAERFLIEIVSVVLLNPTSTHRMQSNRKEKREYEIKKSRPTEKINNSCIVRRCTGKIHEEPPVPHFDRFQARRPGQLEKREKHEPQSLAIPFVANEPRFPVVREIGVVFVIALMRMMLQVINAKTHCTRRKVRKISNDSYHFVPAFAPQNQIVGCIVNDLVVGMIGECAHAISNEKTEPPVAEPQRPHPICDRRLHDHQRRSDQCCIGVAHHQLANFWMRFDDRPRPAWVRLIKLRLIKRGLHRFQYYHKRTLPTDFFKRSSEASLTQVDLKQRGSGRNRCLFVT